jgi:hypothetical protein
MWRTLALTVALGTVLAACGGESAPEDNTAAEAAPPRLPAGSFAGTPVEGSFRDEKGRRLTEVREVISVSQGERRVRLLLGRGRRDRPCLGALIAADRQARLDCFEEWENPPFLMIVGVGGASRRETDWLAVAGVTRDPTSGVELRRQAGESASLRLEAIEALDWHAFAATSSDGNLANTITARAGDGSVVAELDLGWVYNPPCIQGNDNVCGRKPPVPGPWHEVRDPVAAHSGFDSEQAARIAFADPVVRRLSSGHTYVTDGTAGWSKCTGDTIGAVISLRFTPRTDFRGEIPVLADVDENGRAAYRTGRADVEARNVGPVEIHVDTHERRVVGIALDAFDHIDPDGSSDAHVRVRKVVEESRPAGGSDDPSACPEPGD